MLKCEPPCWSYLPAPMLAHFHSAEFLVYHDGGAPLACSGGAIRSGGHYEPTLYNSACESGFPRSDHALQQGLGTSVAIAVCAVWPDQEGERQYVDHRFYTF